MQEVARLSDGKFFEVVFQTTKVSLLLFEQREMKVALQATQIEAFQASPGQGALLVQSPLQPKGRPKRCRKPFGFMELVLLLVRTHIPVRPNQPRRPCLGYAPNSNTLSCTEGGMKVRCHLRVKC